MNTWLVAKNTLVGVILRRPAEEIKMVTRIKAAAYVPFGAAIAVGTLWAVLLQCAMAKGLVDNLPYFAGH